MITSRSAWTRRDFLLNTAFAGAGAAMLRNPITVAMLRGPVSEANARLNPVLDPRVAGIVSKSIRIDTHNHIDVPLVTSEVPGNKIDLAGEMKKSGLSAICMTFAVDYQELRNPGDAYERFKNGLASTDQQLALNGMRRSLNLKDLKAAHMDKEPTVIQSVEGGHFLEGKPERLAEAYGRGLRHLTLLHDHDASVPLGDVFTNTAQWGGLTAFGKEVIMECERLGIVVDLSHADNNTLDAALRVAKKPVLVSHTGLDTQLGNDARMAQMMKPRLISEEQAKIIADAGGVIGVWTHLADTSMAYAQNIRALVEVVGVDHVCIGTDTKLAGNNQDPRRMNQGTNNTWKDMEAGFYYTVVDALLKTGFNEDEILKIGGGNFLGIFNSATH